MVGRILSVSAAAVLACWAGSWWLGREKPLPPGLPPLYYDPFVRQLARHGRYVLACGGGVICEPQRAIDELQDRYGEQGLCDRCFSLLFEQEPDAQYPEGVDATASGIIYRLGDQETLQKLVETRQRLLQLPSVPPPAEPWRRRATPLDRCDALIAGLSHRLAQPLPDGVAPLTDQERYRLFE
jgi:hypothetical protein